MIVPRLLTPVPLAGLPEALDAAHHRLRGFALSPDAYALAEAQLRLEHGTRDCMLRGLWCYNCGNIDATHAELGDPSIPVFQTVPEHEEDAHGRGYSAVHVRRAYPDLDAGLVGYWERLLEGFPEAYDALEVGPDAFAAALRARGYYTASEAVYARALRGLLGEAG